MEKIVVYTDGGSRGNPGPAGAGAVVLEGGKEIATISKFLGIQTNNFAEYEALILALDAARKQIEAPQMRSVIVRMDSELIVKQMNGEYKVRDAVLKKKNARVTALLREFKSVSFEHVRREFNERADELANHAMDNPE